MVSLSSVKLPSSFYRAERIFTGFEWKVVCNSIHLHCNVISDFQFSVFTRRNCSHVGVQ